MLTEMVKSRRLADVQIRRREVIDFFHEQEDKLPSLPERVIMSHILLEVTPSPEAEKRSREKIENILEMLKAGADFDSIACEYSDDPSASEGGRLGFTERGDLVPEYEEVAFQLEPDEISGVVQSRYGLHIIRLLERQGERISTQHILIRLTPTEEDQQRAMELAGELKRRLERGEDFAALAREYSADEETVKKGGRLDEIAVADLPEEFTNAVDAIAEGEIAAPFVSAFGVHVVRLDQRLPARRINLTEDWKTVEQLSLMDKKEKVFREWVNSLLKDHYIWPEGLLVGSR
jgi:peptidyl-prolyl cis-trans isomerase SurA